MVLLPAIRAPEWYISKISPWNGTTKEMNQHYHHHQPAHTYTPILLSLLMWLQASAQPFLVLGILTTALAVGHHDFS